MTSSSRSILLLEHDLFGKPVPAFPDHARTAVVVYRFAFSHCRLASISEALNSGVFRMMLIRSLALLLVSAVIAEVGATSMKDMSRVMKEVQARAQGRGDGKLLSDLVRSSLSVV